VAELDEPRCLTQRHDLAEQVAQRLQVTLAKLGDKSGLCMPVTAMKSTRSSHPRAMRRDAKTPCA
jgi:hypothetical protein